MASRSVNVGRQEIDLSLSANLNLSTGTEYIFQNTGPFAVLIRIAPATGTDGAFNVEPNEYCRSTLEGTDKIWARAEVTEDLSTEITANETG